MGFGNQARHAVQNLRQGFATLQMEKPPDGAEADAKKSSLVQQPGEKGGLVKVIIPNSHKYDAYDSR